MCGAAAGEPHQDDGEPVRLRIGRYLHPALGGDDEPSNLWALCGPCHEGAKNLVIPRPTFSSLQQEVRRGSPADQRNILAWLHYRFGCPNGGIAES